MSLGGKEGMAVVGGGVRGCAREGRRWMGMQGGFLPSLFLSISLPESHLPFLGFVLDSFLNQGFFRGDCL